MSTICLLPPERSHMASSPELAQLVVAAGAWAAVDGSSDPWLQAASSSAAAASRTGHLSRLLIPRSFGRRWVHTMACIRIHVEGGSQAGDRGWPVGVGRSGSGGGEGVGVVA